MKGQGRLERVPEDRECDYAPSQRSLGSAMRVVAAGAVLALAVATGYSLGESRSASIRSRDSSLSSPARQQKLWEGALSRSLARKIVRQQTGEAAHHGFQADVPYSASSAALEVDAKAAATAAAQAMASSHIVSHAARSKVGSLAATGKDAKVPGEGQNAVAAEETEEEKKLAVRKAEEDKKLAARRALDKQLALARHEGSKKKLFNEFVTESKDILIHTPASQQLALTKARPVHTSKAGAPLVSFWDQQLKKVAKERLAQKAAKMATEPDYPEGKPAGEGNSARHSPAAKDAAAKATAVEPDAHKAKGPERGSQAWEREADAKFFDSLGQAHVGSEHKAILKIKDKWARQNKLHELQEREEREKVRADDKKARDEQRNAELAAKRYEKSAFKDMDKHLSSIKTDSVSGFKEIEAKELATEVERDHPNESPQQIAARAMKLLGLVMKSRGENPQVSGAENDLSATGPMGVAPQVHI